MWATQRLGWTMGLLLTVSIFIALLGRLGLYRAQAVVANIAIIVPANTIITVLFIALTPVRWIWYQWLNMKVTSLVSLYTIRPSFWEADWDKLLDSFPIGYGAILDGGGILSLTPSEAQERLRERVAHFPFPMMRKCVGAVLPPLVAQSLLFRLALSVVITPVLAWWLIGFTYIPTLPVWSSAASQREQDSAAEQETSQEEEQEDAAVPDDDAAAAEEEEEPSQGHTVVMEIPECKFLVQARIKYGTEKGNLACLNE